MAPKQREGDIVCSINGKWVGWLHTVTAYSGFLGALIVGCLLHYQKIVQNEHFGYPIEWFPSVSATIGDRYPERSVFQFFIAITSGPRFVLVFLWYILTAQPGATLPKVVAATGIFRTLSCGGWTYVTSTDDHGWHDVFMISYLVATLPWTLGCLALSPPNRQAIKFRQAFAGSFFATLVPMIYYFIQHKVHKVPGAYTTYAFFEWSLILFDVAFDAVTALDFAAFEFILKDVDGLSRGALTGLRSKVLKQDTIDEGGKPGARQAKSTYDWQRLVAAAADIYNGFVFWSILSSLGVLVWYFPLWHMGISGYEALVMSTISPVLLAIPFLRSFIVQNVLWVHLASSVGLAAWLIKTPATRLFAVSFAVSMSCLAWSATWYAERGRPERLKARLLAWSIGLILSSIAKFANHTNNPLWPILNAGNGGWNKSGLFLALVAIWLSNHDNAKITPVASPPSTGKGSATLAGLGLGGLFFALHSLLSDSSTMILWAWGGYPVRGPLPVPHGAMTIVAMSVGLLLGMMYPRMVGTGAMFGGGCIGALMLTFFENWTGYIGGAFLSAYLMALIPVLISSAVNHPPAVPFGLGFFVYNLMVLFHVWVVAYAFVPGGPLVREHTDWVMATTMLLIGAGVNSASTTNAHSGAGSRDGQGSRTNSLLPSHYLHILFALPLLAASVAYLRFPRNDYQPYHADDKVVTAGIWTVHFSLDNDMWSSERRIRDAVRELEVDVIGLLESDLQRIIMGNRDTTQYLAEDLGMYVDYGPGPNKHTWGSALLSKFPIVNSTHHLLPSPAGELAPAIEATIEAYGEYLDIFVFHSGQEEDPEDRRLQSEYLSERMRLSPRPAILLSYLVTKPHKGNYNTYVGDKSGMRDVDPSDWDRWCEYILYKGIRRSGYARVSRGTITDTELQIAKFVVGEPASATDEMIAESQVTKGLRFPDIFKGAGVRGHRYHVFNKPRYFA